MTEIIHFIPRVALDAHHNMNEFIRVCRDELTVFGADLDWDANTWSPPGVSFGNLDQVTPRLSPFRVMNEHFLDFAKAYFRYQHGHKPTESKVEMRALKCLERALDLRGGMILLNIDASLFDGAAVLAREHYSAAAAYHAGRELERLALFLSDKRLIASTLDWKSSIARPQDTVRTGKKAREERERKLPSDEALEALAEIFASNPKAARDVFTTSVAAMLLCAPSRISEILTLQEDCEVWETKRNGDRAYGWRFQPGKGGAPMIKWIPEPMVEVAQIAIQRVRELTAEARRIASWLERHPDRFYRHSGCPQVDETQPLSVMEAAAAVGIRWNDENRCRSELRRLGLSGRRGGNTLSTVNHWVHSRLPEGFPWFDKKRGVRFSEALFCFQERALSADITTSRCVIWRPQTDTFNRDVGPRQPYRGCVLSSVFDRHGYYVDRTKPLKLTSHQFRHLLDTMAQRGGLSQSEIARWAGRAPAHAPLRLTLCCPQVKSETCLCFF